MATSFVLGWIAGTINSYGSIDADGLDRAVSEALADTEGARSVALTSADPPARAATSA